MSYSLFRCIGVVTRDNSIANVVANLAVMWLVIFSGFVLARGTVKKTTYFSCFPKHYILHPYNIIYHAILYFYFLIKKH